MLKKVLLGLLVVAVMASVSAASIKLGVKDIQANATGVEYVITASPVSFTIGGCALDSNQNYILTGSGVLGNGLGLDIVYTGLTQKFSSNLLFQKEFPLAKSGLSITGEILLLSYNSATEQLGVLTGGGRLGLRMEIL